MPARPTIDAILREELSQATMRYEKAAAEFWRISVDVPSGIPYPDGPQRIQSAAKAQTAAMKQRYLAMKRLNAYLIHGLIPDDLKGETPGSGSG